MSRFKSYFEKDLFTGDLVPCSESWFNECVVKYRSQFELVYHDDYQSFIGIDSKEEEFRRYYEK